MENYIGFKVSSLTGGILSGSILTLLGILAIMATFHYFKIKKLGRGYLFAVLSCTCVVGVIGIFVDILSKS